MRLPIGYDIFGKVIDQKLDFVDKSLFIKDILDDLSEVVVITRPRRFGKTFNLTMLQHFLASEVNRLKTQGIFDSLKIASAGHEYTEQQGKYPVIFITFKSVKDGSFEDAYNKLFELIVSTYDDHSYLNESDRLSPRSKDLYRIILGGKANQAQIENALLTLTQCLYQHHGVKPWLLIDEYDTPIQSGYLNGYYDKIIALMRGVFGAALKNNNALHRSVITGILRIARESLFSDVNNLEIYSLLRNEYGQYFGFTEEEVNLLIQQSGLESHAEDIRNWYNGYQMGETTVYNPWSIVNCIKRRGKLIPYWVNTSDNQLIKNLLLRSSEDFKNHFELLLQGKTTEYLINDHFVFGDLQRNEIAVWSLLLAAGYLKVTHQQTTDQGLLCQLDIPNREVRNLYRQIIEQWLANGYGIPWYNRVLEHLLSGNVSAFKEDLKHIMEETVSVHDTSNNPEAFYHGLMVGVTASLYGNKNYEIKSNRESGYGKYDYLIYSHDIHRPTLLVELKRVKLDPLPTVSRGEGRVRGTNKNNSEKLTKALKAAAQEALDQISQQRYLAEIEQRGRTNILKIGLAFCGKRFEIASDHVGV